jgi:uncharacterized repeat protein (TIGR01451 family)
MNLNRSRNWRTQMVGLVAMTALVAGVGLASAPPANAASVFILDAHTVQPAIAGTSVDIAFVLTNNGPDPASNITATFTLPAGFTYAGDDHSCASAPPTVTCSINTFTSLFVGQTSVVTVRANVTPDYVVDNGAGTNTAVATMNMAVTFTGGGQSGAVHVPVGERSDLRIRKYANPQVANAGDAVLYSIDVDNLGPSTARTVTIQDTLFRGFDPGGTPSVTINSCAFSVSQGGGTIAQFECNTGSVATAQFGADIGTFGTSKLQPIGLYPDGSGGFDMGGRMRAAFRLTGTETMHFDNETRVASETFDPDNSNNLAVASNSIEAVADLSLTKTADVPTTTPGGTITYTVTAANNGPSTAQNVVVKDMLPANVDLVSATTPGGVCIGGTPGDLSDPLVCLLGTMAPPPPPPPMPPPPTTEVITIVVKVKGSVAPPASVINQAWITSDTPDLNNANNAAQVSVGIAEGNHLFNPVTPAREFDTRDGTGGVPVGKIPAGGTLAFTITGVNGIPVGATAVSLNVTVEGPESDGHIIVYPCSSPLPLASNLNFLAGRTVANAVIAPVSPAGQVCFFSFSKVSLIADVSGWFQPVMGLTTFNPVREFDTRIGSGGVPIGPRPGGSTLTFKVAGVNGVPASGVGAVALNVTVVNAIANGFITAFPCGTLPITSSLNYVPAEAVPNLVVAPVSPQGNVCFYASTGTDLIADVSGWFANPSELHTVNPTREFDTRYGIGGLPIQKIAGGSHVEFSVSGKNGVPSTGAGAVILNVTADNSARDGYVTVYPCGGRPVTSNVNFRLGRPVPNTVIAPVSKSGTVCFYVDADTDLLADVSGWFEGPGV